MDERFIFGLDIEDEQARLRSNIDEFVPNDCTNSSSGSEFDDEQESLFSESEPSSSDDGSNSLSKGDEEMVSTSD